MPFDIPVFFWYPPSHGLPIAEKVVSPAASCNTGVAGRSLTFPLWLLPPDSSALYYIAFAVGWCWWSSYYLSFVQTFFVCLCFSDILEIPLRKFDFCNFSSHPWISPQVSILQAFVQIMRDWFLCSIVSTVHTEVYLPTTRYTVGWHCSKVPLSMMPNLKAPAKMFLFVNGCSIICGKGGIKRKISYPALLAFKFV